MPNRVIKDCLPIILPFVTSIINASLSSSTFPGIWKTAEITPIPKQGNHELPNNNRPISLLPVLSKVCERVAYNPFVTYLTTKKRLTTKQNGSKKWHSTETSLLRTTDAFLKGIDKKLTTCVLLDMSKAFDSVYHQILLRKLQDVGALTSVLQWFNSYLTNRYQVVRIHSTVSNPIPIEYGVPQGSILRPLLFSIYVNDLPEAPWNCSTEFYVDDTKLFVSFQSQDTQRIVEMNEDLFGVHNWCFRNRLLLNPDKTKLILFGSRHTTSKLHEFRLSLLGKDISPVQSAKDLGMILDSNLTFDHIKITVLEGIAHLVQIIRVKHCLDRTSLLTVRNALVFSKLYYCSNVWANTTEKNIRKLQVVQNFACQIVSGARKYDHVTQHLKSLSWLPVKDQLYHHQATMAFKCISGHASKYLTSQFIT